MKYVTYLTTYKGTLLPPKYIGSTSEANAKSGIYFGSVGSKKWSKIFWSEIQNNVQLFSLEIISYHETREDAFIEELRLQKLYDVVNSPYYFNEAYASKKFFLGHPHSDETKLKIKTLQKNFSLEKKNEISQKISIKLKAAWKKPDVRNKMSRANYLKNIGRKHTEKSKQNMSNAHFGYKQSKETIKKRSESLKGHKMSEKCKKAILQGRLNHPLSEESKKLMSESAKNRKLSTEIRNEMIRKMRIAKQKPRKIFELISPDNFILTFNGLQAVKNFANIQNLSFSVLKNWINRGKIIQTSKKWIANKNWELLTQQR